DVRNDRSARSAISSTTQLIVHDTRWRGKGIADRAYADPDGRSFDHSIGERTLLIEIQAIDPYVAGGLWTEATHLTRAVHADALQSQGQTKGIFGRGNGIVGGMLGPHSGHVENHGNRGDDGVTAAVHAIAPRAQRITALVKQLCAASCDIPT